ncbi:chemotaxis protein CheW [Leptolyngbya sp. FACHB-541]|uniref:chemotaxis protein CheW n=1 Tax=Leptolyngbya sp. FACHB-541 TaxID=2692810 RepID=UPI0016821C54|nr:chemotaxis protein CheW [Leptolyngbya sp. FACHB-541]MBD1995049.1 chemotaxis protein CheW [Leptolyngbya sp. FACHB-541]
MNDSLFSLPSASTDIPRNIKVASQIRTIAFSIGSLKLALRIEAVYKVLKQTPIYGTECNPSSNGDRNSIGIAHVGDREVTVLDLQQRLFHRDRRSETSLDNRYLVIAQTEAGKLCGIPVEAVPTLMEVPLSTIRPLPDSYRHAANLEIVSHVAVLPQAESSLTLFLLDANQLPA